MKSVFGGPVRGHVQVELLSAYLDQQASPAERAYVDAHVQQCAECRAELESLRRTVLLLQALPRVPVPRAFTLSEAQVGIRRPDTSRGWLGGFVRGLGAVAAIALVAFVAVSVLRPADAPWSPAQAVARAPTAAAKAVATMGVEKQVTVVEKSQAEAPAQASITQPTAAADVQATAEPPAAVAAAPMAAPTDTPAAAVAATTAPAAASAAPAPTATGAAALVAKAAPSPAATGGLGAGAPEMGAAAMGRGGGGPSEPVGIPPESLTPEPPPAGQPLAEALPAGTRLAYADLNALWAIDRDGVRPLVQGRSINMPQLSPDQQWVAYRVFTDNGLQVWAVRWEGGQPKLLLDDATLPKENLPEGYVRRAISDTRWAPKGNILTVTLSLIPNPEMLKPQKVELWQVDVETGNLKPVGELGRAWRPYYSPDGKLYLVLQYGTEEAPEGNLSLVDARTGKGKTLLTFPASPGKNGYDNQVVWTPDSKTAWVAIPTADYGTPVPPNGTKLYRVSAGGDVKDVAEIDAVQVNWSPTAATMVYTRYTDETLATNELYVANVDGSQPQLYATTTQGEFIGWSPKGSRFLYQDNFQVFVGAAGQVAKRLANFTSMVSPRWISETQIVSLHDTGNGWLLTLRDVNGDETGLLPLPRESMWDVRSR